MATTRRRQRVWMALMLAACVETPSSREPAVGRLAAPITANGYRFETVDYPGALGTILQLINDQGTAGCAFFDGDGAYVPCYYDGQFPRVDVPGYTDFGEINSVDDRGVMAGDYVTADGIDRGFTLNHG